MTVNKEITRLENSAVKLTVTIAQNDVAANYNELLAKYAKTIQIPGFRKGKVPVSVMERKYGEALKADAAGDIIEKALSEIFEEIDEKPLPYSSPVLDGAPELDTDKDLTFSVTYDVLPKVEINSFDGIEIKVPDITITDADLNEELEAVRQRNALVIDKKDSDAAAKDDIVTVNYVELDENGGEIEDTRRQDFVFTVGTGQNIFKFDDDIIGMKKNETKDIVKTYAGDFEDKDLAGKTKNIRVTVTALKIRDVPALDDELAQDVNEKYKTLDDLKADIRKNMETAVENKMKEFKSNTLIEQLVEKNPFDLPKSMVDAELESRWRMMAERFRTSVEQLDKLITASGQTKDDMLREWTGDSQKALKGRIIVETLLKKYEITVSPEDVEAEYGKIADGAGISAEEVKKHYADPRLKEYLIDDMKEQKLYTKLYEMVKVGKGDKKTFAELFKTEN